ATGVTVDHLIISRAEDSIRGYKATAVQTSALPTSDATLTGTGSLNIGSGGTLNLTGSGTRFIDGGTLNNSGTVNWSGGNNISVYDSGVINNQAAGLFSVKNDQILYQHCCSAGQAFNNAGTFRKSVATGTTSIQNKSGRARGRVDV